MQWVKNSLDMDSGGLKDQPQFFVCQSEVFFIRRSIITSPNAHGRHEKVQIYRSKILFQRPHLSVRGGNYGPLEKKSSDWETKNWR